MSDVITAINLNTQNIRVMPEYECYSCWEVEIVTTKQIIVFSIENDQSCCELYGIYNKTPEYIMGCKEPDSDDIAKTFDFLNNFIGTQIIEVLGMSDPPTPTDLFNREIYVVDFN